MVEQVEIIDEDEVFVRVEHGGPVRLSEGRTGEPWRLESVAKTVRRTSYWSRVPALTTPERKFCRAEIVQSDDGLALGNTNACTPRFFWQETGEKMSLGQSMLSDTPWHMRRVEITERLERDQINTALHTQSTQPPAGARLSYTTARASILLDNALGQLLLCDAKSSFVAVACPRESTQAGSASWTGQTWTGASWPQNASWQSLRENIASTTTQEAL